MSDNARQENSEIEEIGFHEKDNIEEEKKHQTIKECPVPVQTDSKGTAAGISTISSTSNDAIKKRNNYLLYAALLGTIGIIFC